MAYSTEGIVLLSAERSMTLTGEVTDKQMRFMTNRSPQS